MSEATRWVVRNDKGLFYLNPYRSQGDPKWVDLQRAQVFKSHGAATTARNACRTGQVVAVELRVVTPSILEEAR